MKKPVAIIVPTGRRLLVFALVFALGGVLVARAVDLHVRDRDFLQNEGEARQHRVVSVPAHRGMLQDRHGEPLAISTPVDTLWAEPDKVLKSQQLKALASALELSLNGLKKKLRDSKSRSFVYLRRHVDPALSEAAMALAIDGVHVRREYRRYYPAGEVAAHLLGFTDIDDKGLEGLELAYNDWLAGKPGARRVIRDRLGRAIEDIESIRPVRPGKDLQLSIDKRLQYVAYRELQLALQKHGAHAASAVVMDVHSGEVLAIVNQPAYNPNRRSARSGPQSRNRVVTDVLEPGSTMKPITLAAALESGDYQPSVIIETAPGFYKIGRHQVKDHENYGDLDLIGIMRKSSNVGASKIALSLNPQQMWSVFNDFGFGVSTGSGFPGESSGTLNHAAQWGRIEQATLSFGYGLAITPLQLVRAYSAIAADGVLPEVSFLKVDNAVRGKRIISARTARQLRNMLASVVQDGGTGTRANVLGYRVAGKTGTSRKSQQGGYSEDRYMALFAGFAPLSQPEVAVVVVVDEPTIGGFYGGVVAAPVFSNIMASALRLRGSLPDNWSADIQPLSRLDNHLNNHPDSHLKQAGGWRVMAALQMPVTPLLGNLVDGIVDATTLTAVPVSGVALDSRKLAPGYVFFALAGARQHGLDYFDAAIAADVAAILVDAGDARCSTQLQLRAASAGVALLPVPALAEQVGVIASRFFAQPSQSMTVIGVTGTDGKTSVSQYIAQALQRKNNPCGVIGTLGNGIFDNDKPGALTDSGLTTPDAVSVQHTLAGFQQRNITQVAMEVSSHALSQGRVNGVAFDVAVLTNLGRDHLDYHQTLENYHAAKWRLIQADSVRTAVVNIDDPVVRHCLAGHRKTNVIRYATDPAQRADADIFAEDIVLTGQGISMTVIYARQRLPLHSPLIGHFNVSNLLATFATLCALGVDAHDSVARLAGLRAVPGRAERFSAGHCATAVVDYSHTPQALEAILRSMRTYCTGALWCLFGCGGDRDSGKRAPMGAVAENLADCLVITDDNPRHEDGDQIVRDIVSGLKNPDAATIERDREQAIRSVLRQARPEDWVVIAGKGHEDYQIIGDQRIDLSDRDIVTAAMREPGSA